MSATVKFNDAKLASMSLAKVGNPLRDEPVQTSKTLCAFQDEDAELLTHCFLKSFKSLELHRFEHHTDLASNEVYGYAAKVFEDNSALLEQGALIARHLHAKSTHPNIKSGDLCVGLLDEVIVTGTHVQALSIIKSESKMPFLQISVDDGDLTLKTQQGIYPDKIDKGCLVINHSAEEGFLVYVFDKSGNTHFWNRDFLGVAPVRNDDYLTKRYSELCTAFAERGLPEETQQEERLEVANKALNYFHEAEQFDFEDFTQEAFEEPETAKRFTEFKEEYEEENAMPLEDTFTISKAEAKKAKKRLKGQLKLDTGADIKLSSAFLDQAEHFMEKGFDEEKHMSYVKIYYHRET